MFSILYRVVANCTTGAITVQAQTSRALHESCTNHSSLVQRFCFILPLYHLVVGAGDTTSQLMGVRWFESGETHFFAAVVRRGNRERLSEKVR